MVLNLRPATDADVEAMTDIYFDAFADNLIQQRVFPPHSAEARAFWRDGFLNDLKDPNSRFIVIYDAHGPEGKEGSGNEAAPDRVLGFARWVAPFKGHSPPVPDEWPSDGDAALGAEFFGDLGKKHEEIMGDRPHWYLELIGTRKECQGRGAGAMMLGWGTKSADRDQVECYLDSTPAGKGLYLKYGFEERQAVDYVDGQYRQCFMVRKAATTS